MKNNNTKDNDKNNYTNMKQAKIQYAPINHNHDNVYRKISDSYSKDEIDEKLNALSFSSSVNVDLSNYYTKSEIDDKLNQEYILEVNYSDFNSFSLLEDYINSQIINNDSSNNDQGTVLVEIPGGRFEVNDINILSKYSRRVAGLKFRGKGSQVTRIYFNPTNNDEYFFKNNDKWLNLRFEGITFEGNIDKNPNFMLSISNGGAQNYVFTDCFFYNWNLGIDLKGTNNNSEFSFYSCNFNGIIKNFLYCGSDVSQSGDQFLNYNFFACNYEVSEGNFINMARGGNINVYGGSFIHTEPDSETATGGTFFKFPTNNSHNYGVCRLMVIGVRFEHRNRNSKLIECIWNTGNIEFLNCNSQVYWMINASINWINSIFYGYDTFPNIKFDNCSLTGKHEFIYNANGFSDFNNIIYESCSFQQAPQDMFLYETTPSSNFYNNGAKPHIKIRNSKDNISDEDINGTIHGYSLLSRKILNLANSNGSLPLKGGSISYTLPLNSIITKIILYSPENAVSSGYIVKFSVETNETTPTILAETESLSTEYKNGFKIEQDIFFICNTLEKATLTLFDKGNVDQATTKSICLIEYI